MNKIVICMPLEALFVQSDVCFLRFTASNKHAAFYFCYFNSSNLESHLSVRQTSMQKTHQSADVGNRLLRREKYALISRKDALALNG